MYTSPTEDLELTLACFRSEYSADFADFTTDDIDKIVDVTNLIVGFGAMCDSLQDYALAKRQLNPVTAASARADIIARSLKLAAYFTEYAHAVANAESV